MIKCVLCWIPASAQEHEARQMPITSKLFSGNSCLWRHLYSKLLLSILQVVDEGHSTLFWLFGPHSPSVTPNFALTAYNTIVLINTLKRIILLPEILFQFPDNFAKTSCCSDGTMIRVTLNKKFYLRRERDS